MPPLTFIAGGIGTPSLPDIKDEIIDGVGDLKDSVNNALKGPINWWEELWENIKEFFSNAMGVISVALVVFILVLTAPIWTPIIGAVIRGIVWFFKKIIEWISKLFKRKQ